MNRKLLSLLIAIFLLIPHCSGEENADHFVSPLDYSRISPMITDSFPEEYTATAAAIINAFLNYETSVPLPAGCDRHLFMNTIGYILNCSCPPFSALTDFHEVRSYKDSTQTIQWNYTVSREEHQRILADFETTVNAFLSGIEAGDSETTKALLLYMALIQDGVYDYSLIGDSYAELSEQEYNLRASSYYTLTEKSGVCHGFSQALVFLYTQAGLESAMVSHSGGAGAHTWPIMKLDGKYYYCDPTWDLSSKPHHFGITMADRAAWAGGYEPAGTRILNLIVPEKYDVSDRRFEELRSRLPAEITSIEVDRELQTITFFGYEYEYTLSAHPATE